MASTSTGRDLLIAARQHAMWTGQSGAITARQLTDEEMMTAINWLKGVFHHMYDHARICYQVEQTMHDRDRLTMEDKRHLRAAFRSAFRTFLRDLVGGYSIALTIVRHGHDPQEEMTDIAHAPQEAQTMADVDNR